jgi:hypothetical protein
MATTSLNPGVGPTNADIATAVAAPSAATIAAAVAAPSAATIASAVAAPSSSTIATAVAAAVPTLTQINNSVATNAPSPNAWVSIGSITANNTSNTMTFSGLSGYKAYQIIFPFIEINGTYSGLALRINGDSSSVYNGFHTVNYNGGQTYPGRDFNTNQLRIAEGGVGTGAFISSFAEINQANLSAPKSITYSGYAGGSSTTNIMQGGYGSCQNTSTVSSITIYNTGAGLFFNGKTVYLYGAN